ncbi:ABC transporter substrate-binding protein [Ramlibacter sp. Leaf400]|uniref:ABC transporter substrate-binding protein n=1 Tax=Ramlibacter sp. Leaf400 TaxID=1736365 RepID=UPI0006F5BEAF|nr:ABC transporter substrate-binding protein [Ramlibacter sp. Leaf400]KQT09718.1 branched-chain amino acid ABC transporter substrate-binding protein [Ramlibacter sp. Leaf400]
MNRRNLVALAIAGAFACGPALAQKKHAPGITDGEIKIGQTSPLSGPASAYGTIPRVQQAYFKMINEQGGVNGRKLNLIALDDGYSPPKTVEQVRRLVEKDQVAFIFNILGTAPNVAVRKYLNDRKVPQLFTAAGASTFGDYKNYPWTIVLQPSYQAEARIYVEYLKKTKPDAKIALLSGNDDAGKDYVNGIKAALGPEGVKKMIVAEATFESTDPNTDSQVLALRGSGADTLIVHGVSKWASMTIRKVHDIGWQPTFILTATATSVSGVLEPAGLEKAKGLITAYYLKDPNDPQWANDKAYQDWLAFMKKYYPEGSTGDQLNVYGYTMAQALVQTLKQAGNDLSRENIMKQAASLDVALPMLLPGIKVKTGANDYYGVEAQRMMRFNGKTWELFGDLIGDN